MNKTQLLYHHIAEKIQALAIAGYIKEEALEALKYLHYYKIRNVDKNLALFLEYLEFLNEQNTEKVLQLIDIKAKKESTSNLHLHYFLVDKNISKQQEPEYLAKIQKNGYELLSLTQGIKGLLILSIDEFCNASATRMDIHQMLMQRKKKEKAANGTKKATKKSENKK